LVVFKHYFLTRNAGKPIKEKYTN